MADPFSVKLQSGLGYKERTQRVILEGRSFLAKIRAAIAVFESGDSAGALTKLNDLQNQISALSNKKLDTETANKLLLIIEDIKNLI